MKVLVTGHLGFIGRHVAGDLVAHGHEVVGLDVKDGGDILAVASLPRADCVVHLAAKPGVKYSVDHPAECMRTNVEGTVRVLEAARRAGTPKFVFASSSTVYGGLSPYGISKRCGEELCRRYAELYGLDCLCPRFFSVYGPGMRDDLAMSLLARSALPGGAPFRLRGDPAATARDYTYVADVARAVRLAAELPSKPGRFEAFDVCGGSPVTMADLMRGLEPALGAAPSVVDGGPTAAWEPVRTHGDGSRAAELLGWAPSTPFANGVRAFADWWKAEARG